MRAAASTISTASHNSTASMQVFAIQEQLADAKERNIQLTARNESRQMSWHAMPFYGLLRHSTAFYGILRPSMAFYTSAKGQLNNLCRIAIHQITLPTMALGRSTKHLLSLSFPVLVQLFPGQRYLWAVCKDFNFHLMSKMGQLDYQFSK
jgi:hypothetical protein